MDVLTPLTALERLTVFYISGVHDGYLPGSTCAFSMLQQLTALDLGSSDCEVTDRQLHAFAACTALRQLRLSSASSSSPMLQSVSRCLRCLAQEVAPTLEVLNMTLTLH